jgi:hypothetical protein
LLSRRTGMRRTRGAPVGDCRRWQVGDVEQRARVGEAVWTSAGGLGEGACCTPWRGRARLWFAVSTSPPRARPDEAAAGAGLGVGVASRSYDGASERGRVGRGRQHAMAAARVRYDNAPGRLRKGDGRRACVTASRSYSQPYGAGGTASPSSATSEGARAGLSRPLPGQPHRLAGPIPHIATRARSAPA